MAAVTSLVCDVCGSAKDVMTVSILFGGDCYDVELCGNHMRPVAELTAKGRKMGARVLAKRRARYASLKDAPPTPAGYEGG